MVIVGFSDKSYDAPIQDLLYVCKAGYEGISQSSFHSFASNKCELTNHLGDYLKSALQLRSFVEALKSHVVLLLKSIMRKWNLLFY